MDLREGLLNGNKRAAARLITMFENKEEEAFGIIRECYNYTGHARTIGITGPPGSGKSTLTDKLAKMLRKNGKKVGIIAVDPTSPFTGGAILGDRIRMSDLSADDGVFIRSIGTRGSLGGLSKAVYGAVKILDIFGMDYIFIETVGVGQSEVDIIKLADTVVVVAVPGLGDDIQVIKAGIMEIGDVFAVNKSDREGAERTAAEINGVLDSDSRTDRRPMVLNVIASDGKGIDELMAAIDGHYDYMRRFGLLEIKKRDSIKSEIIEIIKDKIMEFLSETNGSTGIMENLINGVVKKEIDPYSAAGMLMEKFVKREDGTNGHEG